MGIQHTLERRALNQRMEVLEVLQAQVCKGRRKVLGSNHLDSLSTLLDLAILWHLLGRHNSAERAHRKVVNMRRYKLGPHHPETIRASEDFATMLSDLGWHKEAEEIQYKCLKRDESLWV